MVDIYYPIVDDISPNATRQSTGGTNNPAKVVGMLAVPIYWRSFMRNILSERSDGIVVVVENPCNQPFTYQIYGPRVVYRGVGDLHDTKYNYLGVSASIAESKNYSLRGNGYSGAPMNPNYCPHTIHIYPSDDMKMEYTSNDAVFFLVSVLLIFLFTSCVFYIYDWYVERRQSKVKSAATHSSAIVSSLFPASVREQIFPKINPPDKVRRNSIGSSFTPTTAPITGNESSDSVTAISSNPIAQVYPDTTVMFADIVGFTAWSSSRDATQVFHLLETIYASFDALARVHGVFKIETIGDCYVAVVGLPKKRKNHAVVMAKFADAIRLAMSTLTKVLEETLGLVRLLLL
jgi:Adenylate and Guanylate cyclase catalytic domain